MNNLKDSLMMYKNQKAREYIEGKDKVLEWGSGDSTLHWMKVVNIFVSLEHNYEWYNKIAPNVSDNVEYYLVPSHSLKDDDELEQHVGDLLSRAGDPIEIDGKTYWNTRDGFDWHCGIDYIRKPFELEHRDYDVVIVDGRCRVMCAWAATFLLKDGGYLLFDDFQNRTYYHGILKWYEVVDAIAEINSDNTMSVLQLRKNELSDEEVVEVSEELYSTFTRITGRIR